MLILRIVFCLFPFLCFGDWAQNTLSQMSLDEKIGQLFMIPACPLRDEKHFKDVENLIEKYHIGGIIIKVSDPISQINLLNRLQKFSEYPLIVSADAEWGLGMRMKDTISFPKNMTLGAIQDNHYIYLLGKEIAKELRAVGVHIDLAPVVDVGTNPLNPIGMRLFSDDAEIVVIKSGLMIKGLQEGGVLACAKHFLSLGAVPIDTHLDLPTLNKSKEELNNLELIPFKNGINLGVSCVMSAHIFVPALSKNPATLSYEIIESLLKKELNFQGLVITDALNMKALVKYFSIEDIAILAHKAGNDILLYGDHINPNIDDILINMVPKAFEAIKKEYVEKRLDEKKLDEHVLKILLAKQKLLLHEDRFTQYNNDLINSVNGLKLKEELYQKAITLVKDDNHLMDGNFQKTVVLNLLGNDFVFSKLQAMVNGNFITSLNDNIWDVLKNADKVILLASMKNFDKQVLNSLEPTKTLIVWFGSPYALDQFKDFSSIMIAYEDDMVAKQVVEDILLKELKPVGKMPIRLLKKE
ncbi:MAG: hypothetical protein HZB76_02850 [Chlamydiae bacterium]|nr:hypothetical protein [Chlamydiota bacterium]